MSRKSRNRSRSRRYSHREQVQRDYRYNPDIEDVLHPYRSRLLYELEDRRRWHPEKLGQRNLTSSGKIARTSYNVVHSKPVKKNYFNDSPSFLDSYRSIVCRRRRKRRRVLFSLIKIGRGKGGSKRRHLTANSLIRC